MAGEAFSRLVIDQGGDIVMVAHLDHAGQYKDPAFTQLNCVNADMLKAEYDTVAVAETDFRLRTKAVLQLAQSKLEAKDAAVIAALQTKIDAIDAAIAAEIAAAAEAEATIAAGPI